MHRRLFNFTSAVSLLLCVAVAVAWACTLQLPNGVEVARPGGNLYSIGAHRGMVTSAVAGPWPSWEIRIAGNSRVDIDPITLTPRTYGHFFETIAASGSLAVDDYGRAMWRAWSAPPASSAVKRIPVTGWGIVMPARFVLMLTAVLPIVWLMLRTIRAVRARRPKPGECRRCRYNLTANTSGVCPECGTPTVGLATVT